MRTQYLLLIGLMLALAPLPALACEGEMDMEMVPVGNTELVQMGPFKLSAPYTFSTTDGIKNGAVFFGLQNENPTSDRILSARAPDIADRVELHSNSAQADKMTMRPVQGFDIPASGHLVLQPSGNHLMLMGLNHPLKAGDSFPLILVFEKAGEHIIQVPVMAVSTSPKMRSDDTAVDDDAHDSHH